MAAPIFEKIDGLKRRFDTLAATLPMTITNSVSWIKITVLSLSFD